MPTFILTHFQANSIAHRCWRNLLEFGQFFFAFFPNFAQPYPTISHTRPVSLTEPRFLAEVRGPIASRFLAETTFQDWNELMN